MSTTQIFADIAERSSSSEFVMTDDDFTRISDLAYRYTGIVLGPHKRDMVYGRLARRLRSLKLSRVGAYLALIEDPEGEEVSQFINAITTNLTAFFRESYHFDFLRDTVFPDMLANKQQRRLRAWSAGSSTGEEVYSIAMTLKEFEKLDAWDCKLLASDLDSKVLAHGRQGVYDADRIESLDPALCKRWFQRDKSQPGVVRVRPELQQLVSFKRLNLLEPWPMKGPFDFIFCRNVVIYFDQPTQRNLFDRYADLLVDKGYLFIGHSESVQRSCDRFRPVGKTVYQKLF